MIVLGSQLMVVVYSIQWKISFHNKVNFFHEILGTATDSTFIQYRTHFMQQLTKRP